ncbi:MAG: hypothetical protein ACSHXZ_06390 [Gammaproteobacteria bacterium]
MSSSGSEQTIAPRTAQNSISRLISKDGMTVSLHAENVGRGEWILRIYGSQGLVSEWMQCFESSVEAMSVGLSAIHFEGIECFYEDPLLAYRQPTSHCEH